MRWTLDSLGWSDFFARQLEAQPPASPAPTAARSAGDGPELTPARIASQQRGLYRLYCEQGELHAHVAGRLRHQAASAADLPVTGDWVLIETPAAPPGIAAEQARVRICSLLKRRTQFSRKAAGAETAEQIVAANLDLVFLVMGLDHDFNLRRLERYITLAWESGAAPEVILNKADLCVDVPARLAAVESVAMGVPILLTSASDGKGVPELAARIAPGRTAALLGSSGVGKSTLINSLLSEGRQAVRTVRHDGRGRHTTTHRELFLLPGGGLLIDTPGMRELQLWGTDESLASAFGDIEGLAAECYFGNCTHTKEPGCAVVAALKDSQVDAARLDSYRRLQRELEYTSMKQEHKASYIERQRWKKAMAGISRLPPKTDRG